MVTNITCSRCGTCVKACSEQGQCIALTDTGVAIDLDKCVVCGHCQAVCPTDEMENPLSPRCDRIEPLPSPKLMANHLRAARSTKFFKPQLISHDELQELINIGRYVQTASNRQGIEYLVLEGQDKLRKLNKVFEEEVLRQVSDNPEIDWVADIVNEQRKTGRDIVFRGGCSQLIFALADSNFKDGHQNAQFSFTFIAALAPSMGIGTCWAGIFEALANFDDRSGKIRDFLDIPEGKGIRAVMMAGYPNITFRRLVERKPLVLNWR